jgi:hypothetical protein
MTEVVVGILAFLGGGTAKALIDWAGKAQLKKLEIASKEASAEAARAEAEIIAKAEQEAFAKQAWEHEARGHQDCLDRLRIVESALANESRRGDVCEANYRALQIQVADMRDAMLAAFVGDTAKVRLTLSTPPGGVPVPPKED